MEVKIITNPLTQARKADAVVCLRVDDLSIPRMAGCVIEECKGCAARIWVAPTSPKGIVCMCYHCVKLHFPKSDEPTLLVSQRTYLGAGPETVKAIKALTDEEA
jgi:hypothetical protein